GKPVKVTGNLVDNQRNRVSAQLPALAPGVYRVRIITQYSSGSTFLKDPRQIDYDVDLTVPPDEPVKESSN
ncbi:MAG: DUF4469 domain-containing protein, partial [Treponema sp.]|nr:DUF4469 domain-containing protein [Treponema sp.]